MIKYFCDICGKELNLIKGYMYLDITLKKGFNKSEKNFQLCDNCQNKFENFLQKELNQESEAK